MHEITDVINDKQKHQLSYQKLQRGKSCTESADSKTTDDENSDTVPFITHLYIMLHPVLMMTCISTNNTYNTNCLYIENTENGLGVPRCRPFSTRRTKYVGRVMWGFSFFQFRLFYAGHKNDRTQPHFYRIGENPNVNPESVDCSL